MSAVSGRPLRAGCLGLHEPQAFDTTLEAVAKEMAPVMQAERRRAGRSIVHRGYRPPASASRPESWAEDIGRVGYPACASGPRPFGPFAINLLM